MRVRFIRPWKRYSPGNEIDGHEGMCKILIQRGIAELVKVEQKQKGKK